MNYLKIFGSIIGIMLCGSIYAQTDKMMSEQKPDDRLSESVEKIYRVKLNDKVFRNSVKVVTNKTEKILLDEADAGKLNQDRVPAKANITKTIMLDNDLDNEFDERLTMSYTADPNSDFVLITNEDEIIVGIPNGDNLELLEHTSFHIDDIGNGQESIVITDKRGSAVNIYIKDYEVLNAKSEM